MAEVTREELAAMTDQELLAYEREHHGDPYMSLLRAKGMQRVALRFWHVGAARRKSDREARAEARRRLLQKLFPSDTAVLESKRVDETGKALRRRLVRLTPLTKLAATLDPTAGKYPQGEWVGEAPGGACGAGSCCAGAD